MPSTHHALVYTADALHKLFARVAHLPWSILLSSGSANHPDNRFDIMVTDPCATLQTCGAITRWERKGTITESTEDPLILLQKALDQLNLPVTPHPNFPFQGGAVGLLGYDLARRFERLPKIAESDLATPDVAIGLYDWAVIADHQRQTLTVITHRVNDTRYQWLMTLPVPRQQQDFTLTTAWLSNMTPEQYKEKFFRIQHHLQCGDCYQVNLAQRFSARYQGDEWQAFNLLNQQNRAPFSAFLRLEQSAILSLSPERFLKLHGGEIETRPIKGTLPRLSNDAEDQLQAKRLFSSTKDRAENLMIVDLMRNDIGRVSQPGTIHVPELFVVESFPAVYHLVSTIRARLNLGLCASDLLRACFPGGSITGAPKIRAMEIIEELEPQRRNAWSGSIGYLSVCGNMDTSITIRTLIAEQGKLFCHAGGGIVADSHPQAEYQETFDKVKRILSCLINDKFFLG